MPFFTTRDGTRLAYEDYGSGPPIVFVAGWVLNAGMWEYQVPCFLERGYRCILPDRRGHGRSDRPPSGYDIDTRADDLAALTGRRTAKLIPGCVYNEYPTAGHGLYVTHAEQINADLAEFIHDTA
jgi:pimeloyl-ACP methyl ester carboxylesterase